MKKSKPHRAPTVSLSYQPKSVLENTDDVVVDKHGGKIAKELAQATIPYKIATPRILPTYFEVILGQACVLIEALTLIVAGEVVIVVFLMLSLSW